MDKEKQITRTAAVTEDGRRSSFRFLKSEWEIIDQAAYRAGLTWVEWAAAAIKLRPYRSKAGAVRAAILDDELAASVIDDRADSVATQDSHPLMRGAGQLQDEDMAELLKGADVQGRQDFGGFKLHYGIDQHGQAFVLIENAMRNYPHLAIVAEGT